MKNEIIEAVRLLQNGELVAFPTETVYGLGADAANSEAVERIFAAKGRPADHPLIVHLPSASYLPQWCRDIPTVAWDLAEAFWPGPLTMILPRGPDVPYVVTGNQETVGVRVPSHPLAQELLSAYAQAGGGRHGMSGLAGPSANRFGRISPTDVAHVRDELGGRVSMVLDGGPCPVGIESTIIDVSRADQRPRILRFGHIKPTDIAKIIGVHPLLPNSTTASDTPRVSGSLKAHYAPRTPLRIAKTPSIDALVGQLRSEGRSIALLAHTKYQNNSPEVLLRRLSGSSDSYARELYAALRELDQTGSDLIVVEAVPAEPEWDAIADRLFRAAYGSGQHQS